MNRSKAPVTACGPRRTLSSRNNPRADLRVQLPAQLPSADRRASRLADDAGRRGIVPRDRPPPSSAGSTGRRDGPFMRPSTPPSSSITSTWNAPCPARARRRGGRRNLNLGRTRPEPLHRMVMRDAILRVLRGRAGPRRPSSTARPRPKPSCPATRTSCMRSRRRSGITCSPSTTTWTRDTAPSDGGVRDDRPVHARLRRMSGTSLPVTASASASCWALRGSARTRSTASRRPTTSPRPPPHWRGR